MEEHDEVSQPAFLESFRFRGDRYVHFIDACALAKIAQRLGASRRFQHRRALPHPESVNRRLCGKYREGKYAQQSANPERYCRKDSTRHDTTSVEHRTIRADGMLGRDATGSQPQMVSPSVEDGDAKVIAKPLPLSS